MLFFKNRKSRRQLLQENEYLKDNIEWLEKDLLKSVKTITAKCMTVDTDISSEDQINSAKEYLCKEIGRQLLPYIKYENYAIVDECSNEMKHIGTIDIFFKK